MLPQTANAHSLGRYGGILEKKDRQDENKVFSFFDSNFNVELQGKIPKNNFITS
jgi:hypothetical protein